MKDLEMFGVLLALVDDGRAARAERASSLY
jgi:hypothetical protein